MHEAAPIDYGELDREIVALLPTRDTLGCQFACVNVNTIVGVNLAFAINAASSNVTANAVAGQYLAIYG
jgi:hypothetical protein